LSGFTTSGDPVRKFSVAFIPVFVNRFLALLMSELLAAAGRSEAMACSVLLSASVCAADKFAGRDCV